MKALLMIIVGLGSSWHFTDIASSSLLSNALAPFGVFIFMCALLLWLVVRAGFGGKASHTGVDSTSSDYGDSGGF